jgi:hypothetical protein
MSKLNLKNVAEIKNLPTGRYNLEVQHIKDGKTESGEPLVTFDMIVIDDIEFNNHHVFKNYSPESEKSLPYLVQLLKALGLSDSEISGIEDTKQLENICIGKKVTVSYKESKEFAWGTINNPRLYEP